jgi:hypothetical protein
MVSLSDATPAQLVDELRARLAAEPPQSQSAVDALQALLETGVAEYFRRREAGEDFGPFRDPVTVSATAAMIAAANILQAVEVEIFELGMWKTLTGS